jgi:hypothetical protein
MGVASGASAAPIGAATIATGGLGIALNSVLWPILAVVATVALVAGGAYLLIKNWDSVSVFFINFWNGFMGIVAGAANWFTGIWGTITTPFAEAFIWIGTLFTSIWDGIKDVVLRFVAWMSPVIDMILAPFRAIGNAVGGIVDTVGGWFGKAADAGNEAIKMRTSLAEDTAPKTVNAAAGTVTKTASSVFNAPITRAAVVVTPELGASIQTLTPPELGSAQAMPNLTPRGTAVPDLQSALTTSAIAIPAQTSAPQTMMTTASSGNSPGPGTPRSGAEKRHIRFRYFLYRSIGF